MKGSSLNDSLFYSGKTTYGGISSQKKRKLQETSPQQVNIHVTLIQLVLFVDFHQIFSKKHDLFSVQMTPNKRQVRAKPLTSNVSGISSSSARRILSTLERMSSPLSDAKKIPSYNSSLVDSPLSFSVSYFSACSPF